MDRRPAARRTGTERMPREVIPVLDIAMRGDSRSPRDEDCEVRSNVVIVVGAGDPFLPIQFIGLGAA